MAVVLRYFSQVHLSYLTDQLFERQMLRAALRIRASQQFFPHQGG